MKKNIAVIAGGFSGEHDISMNSAKIIMQHMDKGKYSPFLIHITKEKWVNIDDDHNEVTVDKNDFSITVNKKKIVFDCVFNIIHGTPGEDGKMQGYLDMLGIPCTSSNHYVSGMTFNKAYCNKIVSSFNVRTPNSIHLIKGDSFDYRKIIDTIKLPAFVKPCNGGSSVGTSKVKDINEMEDAINIAFQFDDEVLVEEFINGIEITCGVLRNKEKLIVFPITEIVSKNDFFDYSAKYDPGMAEEITPAQISHEIEKLCSNTSSLLFKKLNCNGVVRFDYILTASNKLYFLEINTIPGMSDMSIVPKQAKIYGYELSALIEILIENAIDNKKG